MNLTDLREYCLAKPGVTESLPFDENVLVFKVMGKMFLLTDINWEEKTVNLKCDPDYALELRGEYAAVRPGYHMNKKYWNTVDAEGELDDDFLRRLIDHSYDEVVKGLPKKVQAELRETGK